MFNIYNAKSYSFIFNVDLKGLNRMNKAPQNSRSKKKKLDRNKKLKIYSISLAVVAILLAISLYALVTISNVNKSLGKIQDNNLPTANKVDNVNEDPFTILFIGLGTNGDDGEATLADSINLITVNPKKKFAEVFAIPRDSYLPFGASCEWGIGMYDKVTHTTGISPECLQDTLEDVFQININYYVSVNFNGFLGIVNALGGVEMEVPDLRAGFEAYPGDPSDGLYLDPALKTGTQWCEADSYRNAYAVCFTEFGMQKVNGEQALALARSRHYDSDYSRSYRQTELIKAIANKSTSISGALSINGILEAAGDSIETNIPADQFMTFATLAKSLLASKDENSNDSSFQMRTTQLAGQGATFSGQRLPANNVHYSVVPTASVEDIRNKLAHALRDGEPVISPGGFDFTIEPDANPTTYTYDETLDKRGLENVQTY